MPPTAWHRLGNYPLFLNNVAGGLAAARRKWQDSDGQSADPYGLLAKDNDGTNLEVVLHLRKVVDKQASLLGRSPADGTADQNNRWLIGSRSGQQGTEICIGANQDPVLGYGLCEDHLIGGACQSTVSHMDNVVTRLDKIPRHGRRKIFVQQQPHAPGRNGSSRSRTASAA